MSRRLTDRIAPWIETALERQVGEEEAEWDVTLATNADQGPVLMLLIWMKGAVLGSVVHAAVMFGNPYGLTQEDVDRMVPQLVEALREQRTAQLAGGNGSAHREFAPEGFEVE